MLESALIGPLGDTAASPELAFYPRGAGRLHRCDSGAGMRAATAGSFGVATLRSNGGGRDGQCVPDRWGGPEPDRGAASVLPRGSVRLSGTTPGRAVRAGRRAAGGRVDALAAAPEPAPGAPPGLGQRVRRAGRRRGPRRPDRRVAGREDAPGGRPGVRRGRQHLAPLRRGMLAGPRLLLLAAPALGRPADRGRLVLLLDRPARLRPRLVDRPGRCPPGAGG